METTVQSAVRYHDNLILLNLVNIPAKLIQYTVRIIDLL